MSDSQLVVVSGGPGAGKTTLVDELKRRGFCCVPEVARQIIQEQVRDGAMRFRGAIGNGIAG